MALDGKTYVIARYKEDISWADNLNKVVIQKDFDMPNVGREPSSFFHFIIENYNNLRGEYVFCQGNPFDHAPDLLTNDKSYYGDWLESDGIGFPHHAGLPVGRIAKDLGLAQTTKFMFKPGMVFKTDANTIRYRPISFYLKCLELCCMEPDIPYVFERIVPLIFNLN